MKDFLNDVLKANSPKYSSLIFNLYEDEKNYSMDAEYDESYAVRRDNPVIICSADRSWQEALKDAKHIIVEFYSQNKDSFKNLKFISYGFVDGDLYYLKKGRKTVKKDRVVTYDELKSFPPAKLDAWLAVYLKEDVKNRIQRPFASDFAKMSDEELDKWARLLADNFDYDKYYKLKK